jgi:hypothetical protein
MLSLSGISTTKLFARYWMKSTLVWMGGAPSQAQLAPLSG